MAHLRRSAGPGAPETASPLRNGADSPMRELLTQLLDTVAAAGSVAYCRLVETRGSTPQKAGAAMLVFADGSQSGTLGGGCVEAEVKRRALARLEQGRAEICDFQLDNDYGWDDGLICGGRMLVLVEAIGPRSNTEYFSRLRDQLASRQGCTEAIVFDAEKSGLEATTCYLVDTQGQLLAERQRAAGRGTVAGDRCRCACRRRDRVRPQAVAGVAYLPHRAAQHCSSLAADTSARPWATWCRTWASTCV